MLTIRQVSTPPQIAAIRDLVREFTDWANDLTADSDQAPAVDDLEQHLADLPGEFAPPGGCLLLACLDDQPVGCVAFWAVDDQTVELKRMYLRPGFRGRRIGEQLVAALITEARARLVRRIVLDTWHTMTAAHGLYRAAGFRIASPPPDFPPKWRPCVVFMDLDIPAAGADAA